MEEHWKDIQGYEGLYSVSDTGFVKTHIYNKILKPRIQDGYETVVLYRNKKYKAFRVHRLVAIAFLDNPNNYEQVNHIDGNKLNNMANNLRWCTQKENNNNPVTRKRISESHKGKELTSKQKEVLHKMQQMKPMLGRKHSEETLAKLRLRKNRAIPVAMMDKDGNILKTFDSIIQAERELGIRHSNISNCCLGKYKTSGGYKWKYLQKRKRQ